MDTPLNNRSNNDNQRSRHHASPPAKPSAIHHDEKDKADEPAHEYYPEFDNTSYPLKAKDRKEKK